jgi:hypothetical protein
VAIVSETATREGTVTVVRVTSDLTPPVYFFWYVDGAYVGSTTGAGTATSVRGFGLPPDDQVRIDVLDSTDPAFDALAAAPDGYPARRTLTWIRSIDAETAVYRVEQQREAEGYEEIGYVGADAATWQYQLLSPRLDDLTTYDWRVIPVDASGVDGTPIAIGPESIVRRPDAPEFTVTAAATGGGAEITFTEAA